MVNRIVLLFQNFLPNQMIPVEERYVSDEASMQLIQAAEDILDNLIEEAEQGMTNRRIRRKEKQYTVICKITKRKFKLLLFDTKYSSALVKKRIHLECYRKYIKSVNGTGKVTHAFVHYIHQGETFVRSVKKASLVQPLFYKLDMLDDALLGQFVNRTRLTTFNRQLDEKDPEVYTVLNELKRVVKYQSTLSLDPLLHNRLQRVIGEAESLIPHFNLLEIEEKYLLKRMLKNDLPKLMHSYISLTNKHQTNHKEDVFVALSKMELSLIALSEQVEKEKVLQLKRLLKVTDKRYASPYRK